VELRPYQLEVARAVMDSIQKGMGLTFSVEIARQGGKNELSAHLEVLLLTLYMARGGNIVKCSPTFKPQTVISMERLKQRLDDFGFDGIYRPQMGYIVQLGNSKVVFLSAEGSSSVVGHTADILLEIDESQDVGKDKYTKEFRPMGSATNVTTILYGTTWDDSTLLEEVKQANLELQRKDGIKRHFRYDWQEVGRYNPDYLRFVQSERERLGEEHPLFRTQYALLPISHGGGFLSRQQIALMMGEHQRRSQPDGKRTYIAGIDLAGEHESETSLRGALATKQSLTDMRLPRYARKDDRSGRDSSVITIAEVDAADTSTSLRASPSLPLLKVVEQYQWTGTPHSQLYAQMTNILKNVWNCQRIVVDATGIGQPVASFLRQELGSRVIPLVITSKSKSDMGFELLSFVNSGRLKLYEQDGSPEYRETLFELERARAQYRPNQTMNFYVDPQEGHDDFLVSLALVVQAAKGFSSREAKGWLKES
jgi:Terminase RNaseH-like domain